MSLRSVKDAIKKETGFTKATVVEMNTQIESHLVEFGLLTRKEYSFLCMHICRVRFDSDDPKHPFHRNGNGRNELMKKLIEAYETSVPQQSNL